MKVVIYVRVSTQEQALEGYSIAAQISVLKAYALSYSYTIVQIYEDQGISGKNIKDRPGLLQLIEDANQNKFDSVLVWKLSRLSRSLLDLLSIVEVFKLHNISFISYSEHFDTSTPIGKMLLQLLGSIAEFERNTIIENVKLGLGERFKRGYSKGSIPFGYMYEDKKAVIVPDHAEAVKFAFEYYLKSTERNPVTIITNYFNSKGFKTRVGTEWNRHIMKTLLMNKFYAGYVRTGIKGHGLKKENYDECLGSHEPLISLKLYDAVQEKMKSFSFVQVKSPDNECFLTGLIMCPQCGKKLYALAPQKSGLPYTTKSGEVHMYTARGYRCVETSYKRGRCKGFNISSGKIEPQFLEFLRNGFTKATLKKSKVEYLKEIIKNEKPIIDNIKIIENKLKELYTVRDRYYKLFDTGKVDIDLFADKINSVLSEINTYESQREEEYKNITQEEPKNIDIDSLYIGVHNFLEYFDKLNNDERKTAIRYFVKCIYLTESKQIKEVELINGMIIPG